VGDLITPTNENTSGIYLFRDRNTITHYFAPNFSPDTAEKIQLVQKILAERWDEASLSWRPAEAGLLGGSAAAVNQASSSVQDNDQSVGDTADQGHHDGAQGRDDVPGSKQQRRRRQRQLPVVLPKSTNNRGTSSLYQKLVVAARGGSKSGSGGSSRSSSVPSDTDKKKDRRYRGRPRSQRPAVFTSAGGVEGGSAKTTTTPRSSGLFHLRRTTPHGIVEEIPATAAAE
jgi:hypothetical protein